MHTLRRQRHCCIGVARANVWRAIGVDLESDRHRALVWGYSPCRSGQAIAQRWMEAARPSRHYSHSLRVLAFLLASLALYTLWRYKTHLPSMSSGNKDGDVHHSLHGPHAPRLGDHDAVAKHLEDIVRRTETEHETHVFASSPGGLGKVGGYLRNLSCIPSEDGIDERFAKWKMGNYVAIRGSDERIFESMPLYVRVGMHLLFYKSRKASLLHWGRVEDLLREQSQHEGKIYDDTSDKAAVQDFIKTFISTYKIDTSQLEQPDLTKYKSRNEFFYRKLRSDARPIAEPDNKEAISSAADCRLMVFDDIASAKRIWVKGHDFSVKELLGGNSNDLPETSSMAIFRLAPADYHRYTHPVGPAKVLSRKHAGTEYYTVNPDAVNEDFDVFTGNTRDVTILEVQGANGPIKYAFVSIGALLVGSNRFTGADIGSTYQRGDEMGYYAYGGSTNIVVFPPEAKVKWDADLMANSQKGLETLVKCNEHIGAFDV